MKVSKVRMKVPDGQKIWQWNGLNGSPNVTYLQNSVEWGFAFEPKDGNLL